MGGFFRTSGLSALFCLLLAVGGFPALSSPLVAATAPAQVAESSIVPIPEQIDETQARWQLARLLSWARDYPGSLALYDRLAADQPEEPVFQWEAARVASWAKDYQDARQRYDRLLMPPIDQAPIVLSRLEASPELQPRPESAPPYWYFEQLLGREGLDPALTAEYPRYRIQKAVYLESRSKEGVRQRRPRQAMALLTELLAFNPENREAFFDLAQVQCGLGLCDQERQTYQGLLALDPFHGLAARQLELIERRRAPQLSLLAAHSRESGRDELADLTATSGGLQVRLPFGARNHLELQAQRWRLGFDHRPGVNGNRLQLSLAGVIDQHWRWSGDLARQDYSGRQSSGATTGGARLEYSPVDQLTAGLELRRHRELGNRFSLEEPIYNDQIGLDFLLLPSGRVDLAGQARWLRYSDDNRGLLLKLSPGLRLTDHPREFKISLVGEYRDTRHETAATYDAVGRLTTVQRHPYWTPRDHWFAGLLLEWRHDLAESFACGALEHFYHLRLSPGLSSDNNNSLRLEADYVLDLNDRLRLRAGGFIHESKEWDSAGLQLVFTWYF